MTFKQLDQNLFSKGQTRSMWMCLPEILLSWGRISSIIRQVHWAKNQQFVTVKTQDQIFKGKNWNAITSFHEADMEYCGLTFNAFFVLKSDMDKHYQSTALGDYWYYFVVRCGKTHGRILFSLGYFYIKIFNSIGFFIWLHLFYQVSSILLLRPVCWGRLPVTSFSQERKDDVF